MSGISNPDFDKLDRELSLFYPDKKNLFRHDLQTDSRCPLDINIDASNQNQIVPSVLLTALEIVNEALNTGVFGRLRVTSADDFASIG